MIFIQVIDLNAVQCTFMYAHCTYMHVYVCMCVYSTTHIVWYKTKTTIYPSVYVLGFRLRLGYWCIFFAAAVAVVFDIYIIESWNQALLYSSMSKYLLLAYALDACMHFACCAVFFLSFFRCVHRIFWTFSLLFVYDMDWWNCNCKCKAQQIVELLLILLLFIFSIWIFLFTSLILLTFSVSYNLFVSFIPCIFQFSNQMTIHIHK